MHVIASRSGTTHDRTDEDKERLSSDGASQADAAEGNRIAKATSTRAKEVVFLPAWRSNRLSYREAFAAVKVIRAGSHIEPTVGRESSLTLNLICPSADSRNASVEVISNLVNPKAHHIPA